MEKQKERKNGEPYKRRRARKRAARCVRASKHATAEAATIAAAANMPGPFHSARRDAFQGAHRAPLARRCPEAMRSMPARVAELAHRHPTLLPPQRAPSLAHYCPHASQLLAHRRGAAHTTTRGSAARPPYRTAARSIAGRRATAGRGRVAPSD